MFTIAQALPTDILRLIFELSADESYENSCHLVLVCQYVNAWVIPRLYHSIVFCSSNKNILRVRILMREQAFIRTIHAHPTLTEHVRFISSLSFTPISLSIFPRIIGASFNRFVPIEQGLIPSRIQSLKYLRSSPSAFYPSENVTLPNLTHLSLWYISLPDIASWFSRTCLVSLTHLLIEDSIPKTVGRIKTTLAEGIFPHLPKLRVCILSVCSIKVYMGDNEQDMNSLLYGHLDNRIIIQALFPETVYRPFVLPPENYFRYSLHDTKMNIWGSFWDVAETFLQDRNTRRNSSIKR